jgi:hypothetical protein
LFTETAINPTDRVRAQAVVHRVKTKVRRVKTVFCSSRTYRRRSEWNTSTGAWVDRIRYASA